MAEFVKPTNAEMSARLRALAGPSRVVEGLVFRIFDEEDGDVWSDLVDCDDEVWSRRDPEDRAAWDLAPPATSSFDEALRRKIPGIRIVSLSEQPLGDGLDPAWRAWRCEVTLPTSLRSETFVGLGATAAIALLDAVFQVHGFLAGEEAA